MCNAASVVASDVPIEMTLRLQRFLHREARLLDARAYHDWLKLLADDIHYWMPVIENRFERDPAGPFGPERMAYFDDGIEDLRRRVTRFTSPSAWMETPATRHVHIITNVEVEPTELPDEWRVHSAFVNYRNRGDDDEAVLIGRRQDVIRLVGDSPRLARRLITLAQSMLLTKNINTFL